MAAQGDFFRIWLSGVPRKIGGTSASSPTFAGIIALLNDVRLREGKAPLGFLNPWIYSTASIGFNDITIGHNGGCGTYGFNVSVVTLCIPFYLNKGFRQATTGWDPGTYSLFFCCITDLINDFSHWLWNA